DSSLPPVVGWSLTPSAVVSAWWLRRAWVRRSMAWASLSMASACLLVASAERATRRVRQRPSAPGGVARCWSLMVVGSSLSVDRRLPQTWQIWQHSCHVTNDPRPVGTEQRRPIQDREPLVSPEPAARGCDRSTHTQRVDRGGNRPSGGGRYPRACAPPARTRIRDSDALPGSAIGRKVLPCTGGEPTARPR